MKTDRPDNRRLYGLLGLARRAGRLITGFDAVKDLVLAGRAQLVMTAADLSEKTEKELLYALRGKAARLLRLPADKEDIGRALGLDKPVGVLALEDKGFAASFQKLCDKRRPDSRDTEEER